MIRRPKPRGPISFSEPDRGLGAAGGFAFVLAALLLVLLVLI
jgi:hypothetical protein